MTKERRTFLPLTSSGICEAYELLRSDGLVSFPLTSDARTKTDALVANITGTYFGTEIYKSPEEKAVAYLYFLINNHPFTDGNKRTAVLSFRVVCLLNKLEPTFRGFTLDALAVLLEKEEGDHHEIISAVASLLFGE